MLSPRDSTQPGKQCSAATFYRRHLAASAAEGQPSSYPDKSVEVSQRERAVTSSSRIEVALDD